MRLTIPIPPHGFGHKLNEMIRWLDEHIGKENYAWLPAQIRGAEATHLYVPDMASALAFEERWGVVASIASSSTAAQLRPLGGPSR